MAGVLALTVATAARTSRRAPTVVSAAAAGRAKVAVAGLAWTRSGSACSPQSCRAAEALRKLHVGVEGLGIAGGGRHLLKATMLAR